MLIKPRSQNDRYIDLVNDLRRGEENAVVEFKKDNKNPELIGKYISALANAATLEEKQYAYLLWGVDDVNKNISGTDFDPEKEKKEQQPLQLWLAQRLKPDINFRFYEVIHPEGRLVLLEIPATVTNPITFNRISYIRIGSATPRLADYPQKEAALWDKLRSISWEKSYALYDLSSSEVVQLLDVEAYFRLTKRPLPEDLLNAGLKGLRNAKLLVKAAGQRWNITNLAAILLGRDLSQFSSSLGRKGIRFISYQGKGRSNRVVHRIEPSKGYALAFPEITQ